jgi:hypothetical protein
LDAQVLDFFWRRLPQVSSTEALAILPSAQVERGAQVHVDHLSANAGNIGTRQYWPRRRAGRADVDVVYFNPYHLRLRSSFRFFLATIAASYMDERSWDIAVRSS